MNRNEYKNFNAFIDGLNRYEGLCATEQQNEIKAEFARLYIDIDRISKQGFLNLLRKILEYSAYNRNTKKFKVLSRYRNYFVMYILLYFEDFKDINIVEGTNTTIFDIIKHYNFAEEFYKFRYCWESDDLEKIDWYQRNKENLDMFYEENKEKIDRFYEENKEKLYCGLLIKYDTLIDNFYNAESAIKHICKFYEKELDQFVIAKHDISAAKVLYMHMKECSTGKEYLKVHYGVKAIETYIGSADKKLVLEILENYRQNYWDILNRQDYRSQIYAIIFNSAFDIESRKNLKFFYFENVKILNELRRLVSKYYTENKSFIEQDSIRDLYSTDKETINIKSYKVEFEYKDKE